MCLAGEELQYRRPGSFEGGVGSATPAFYLSYQDAVGKGKQCVLVPVLDADVQSHGRITDLGRIQSCRQNVQVSCRGYS